VAILSERRSAAVAESLLQLVEVLTSVLAAGWVDGTIRVERSHPVWAQLGYACVRLLRDPEGEFGCRLGAMAWMIGRVESVSLTPSGSSSEGTHGSPRSILSAKRWGRVL
jgi:hypothetical protein